MSSSYSSLVLFLSILFFIYIVKVVDTLPMESVDPAFYWDIEELVVLVEAVVLLKPGAFAPVARDEVLLGLWRCVDEILIVPSFFSTPVGFSSSISLTILLIQLRLARSTKIPIIRSAKRVFRFSSKPHCPKLH
jgi:hypothetical protein